MLRAWSCLLVAAAAAGSPATSAADCSVLFSNSCTETDVAAPLVTDRPNFTEATRTVGRGMVQLEFGYARIEDDADGVEGRRQSFGEPLLRLGILRDWLEWRVAAFPTEQRIRADGRETTDRGLADLYTGFKLALTEQRGAFPEMAIIPQAVLPTGDEGLTSDRVEPGLNWIYAWSLTDRLSTAGSTQANRRVDGATGSDYVEIAQSWAASYGLSDTLGGYVEVFFQAPDGADTVRNAATFNTGLAILLDRDFQFDVRIGTGLDDDTVDLILGAGFSIRFADRRR